MTNEERYTILNAARRVLDEIHAEHYSSDMTHGAPRGRLAAHGMVAALSEVAEEAIFDTLNTLTHHVGDETARAAMDERSANRDLDPEVLMAALRLSERERRPLQACSDGEHEADIEAGDMLGRRP